MHERNNHNKLERRRETLKGFSSILQGFSFLLFLSLFFFSILLSGPASALQPSDNSFSTLHVSDSEPLVPTPRIVTSIQNSSEAASNSTLVPSILILDGEDIYVRSGDYHNFYQGYRLYVKGTSTEEKRVWLELRLEDEPLEDFISSEGNRLVYTKNSSEILNLTVKTIYSGTEGVLVRFDPVYQYLDLELPSPGEHVDSEPMSPIIPAPSQGTETENKNKRVAGFGSSLVSFAFLLAVFQHGGFPRKSKKLRK
ncbi:MAG: hypothetical protein PHD41_00675 [Methanosarcinaceae archaeon]|nr:hypothetical protein [Methanosarcinaceae archaeon]MDD4330764.1 hypothetical protein [Methanosarcinaceae archaeon]MDD4748535.1 hypothetical protein [Methanosarcinaceae archaeon]